PRRVPGSEMPPLPRRTAGASLAGRSEQPAPQSQKSQAEQPPPRQQPPSQPPRRQERPRQESPGPARPGDTGSPPPPPPPPPLDTPDRDRDDDSPIFEQMASAWFRDNWQTPGGSPEQEAPAGGDAEPGGNDSGWGTDADWNIGEPLLQPMPEQPADEVTPAGLPKRRPKSHLFPGGGEDADRGPAPAAPVPSRTAEQIRGRLASYQRGVRQGRHARQHQPDEEPGGTGNGRHVEQGHREEGT
ncbi:MAG: hypothetical protein J2P20_10435, partial [Pseudonocardia sp.]|nr:hypothetical protein [Pseudonocardia sp.]